MTEAVAYARARKGPALVHAKVTRPYSHSLSDDEKLYKTPDERAAEAKRDPIVRLAAFLKAEGLATEARARGDRAARSTRRSTPPPSARSQAEKPTPDTVGALRLLARRRSDRPTAFDTRAGAARQAGHDGGGDQPNAERRDGARPADRRVRRRRRRLQPRVRARDTSPARAASSRSRTDCSARSAAPACSIRRWPRPTSSAAPSAWRRADIKPVVEIQFFDYIWPAMMQMRDEMSMLRYRSNNAFSCPMVIRTAIGGYLRGGAPYHSQSGESIFAHCPGIRVVFPSNAQDAAGLLRTAIRCDDPVLFLEHKHLYRQTYNKGEYPGPDYMVPFGKAAVRREGSDVVVHHLGRAGAALAARGAAGGEGRHQRRWSSTCARSRRSTGTASRRRSSTPTASSSRTRISSPAGSARSSPRASPTQLFEHLDAPVRRVAALDTPVAYYPDLEEVILPQSARRAESDPGRRPLLIAARESVRGVS